MNSESVTKIIEDHVDLIAIDAKGLAAARERAAKFLMASSVLLTYQKDLKLTISKLQTMVDAQYEQCRRKYSDAKNVTEKKIMILADKDYAKMRNALEKAEAEETWVKGHIKIFENAHLQFRQYARE